MKILEEKCKWLAQNTPVLFMESLKNNKGGFNMLRKLALYFIHCIGCHGHSGGGGHCN